MNRIEILATGPELIRRGIRGIEPVLEEIINDAENEIQTMAYIFTPRAMHLLNLMERAAERGIKIDMIINHLESQDEAVRSKLGYLSSRFPHVRIFNFIDQEGRQLHAKIVVVDRKRAVMGSANFSWGGMHANYEIGLLLQGEAVWGLASIIDFLVQTCRRVG
jgi:cardiolipin synthase